MYLSIYEIYKMKKIPIIVLLACMWQAPVSAQITAAGYTNYTMHGFNVLVQDTAFQVDSQLTADAMAYLDSHLLEITNLCATQNILDSFRTVSIFMDWYTSWGAGVYHPSESWLIANGYGLKRQGILKYQILRIILIGGTKTNLTSYCMNWRIAIIIEHLTSPTRI